MRKKQVFYPSSSLIKTIYETKPVIKFYKPRRGSKKQTKMSHCSIKLPVELARYYYKGLDAEKETIRIRNFRNCFVCDLKLGEKYREEVELDKEILNEVKKLVGKEKEIENYEEILHKTLLEIILSYSLFLPNIIVKISKENIEWMKDAIKREILRKLESELGCSLTMDNDYLYFEFNMDKTKHGFDYAKSAYEKIVKTLKILSPESQEKLTQKINTLDERAIRQNERSIDEVYSQYMNHLWLYAEPIFCPYFVIVVELLSDEIEKLVYILKKMNEFPDETLKMLFRHITLCSDSLSLYDKIFDNTNKDFSVYHFKIEKDKEKCKRATKIIYQRRKYDIDFQIDNLNEEESKLLYAPLYRIRSLASILASLYIYLGVGSVIDEELSSKRQ
ncbi:MAG TPA: hypothetical protein ENI52_04515 [Thermoplasmata archaeon]|nr:hypothetical protein [Thermoplasmata archaeon]